MPRTNLWTLHDQRAALAQRRIRFQQDLMVLVKIKFQSISVVSRTARIDVQRKMFAGGEPVFFTALQRFARLADYLELVVPKVRSRVPFMRCISAGSGAGFVTLVATTNPLQTFSLAWTAELKRLASARSRTRNRVRIRYLAAYSDGSDFRPSTHRTVTRSCFVWKIETVASGLTFGSTRAFKIWVRYCD